MELFLDPFNGAFDSEKGKGTKTEQRARGRDTQSYVYVSSLIARC